MGTLPGAAAAMVGAAAVVGAAAMVGGAAVVGAAALVGAAVSQKLLADGVGVVAYCWRTCAVVCLRHDDAEQHQQQQ